MTASVPSPSAPALRLARAGVALLVILPLGMWLANRSAPLVLGLAAVCLLGSALIDEGAAAVLQRLRASLRTPIGFSLATFLLWSLLTILWSHRPGPSFAMWGELAIPLASSLAIAASGRFRPGRDENRALAVSIIAASIFMMAELASGLSARIALDIGKQASFVFNRPALTCVMLLPAVAAGLVIGRDRTRFDRLLCAVLALVVATLSFDSESGAAAFGLLIMLAVWLVARLLPRFALVLVGAGFVAAMLLAPVMGRLADEMMPPALHQKLAGSHTRERVDIWLSFGEAAMARPFLGAGFGTSATLDRHPVALAVSPQHRQMLAAGHPHNAPMQAWVETGVVGAGLLTFAGLALLWRLQRLPARDLAPRLALAASAFGVATVAHGAWQGWWIAILGLAAVWLFCSLPAEAVEG